MVGRGDGLLNLKFGMDRSSTLIPINADGRSRCGLGSDEDERWGDRSNLM